MKRLATIAVLVAIVGSIGFAQAKSGGIARQISMGGSNVGTNLVLNPFIMEDPSLMLWNPAYQTMYKDYIWMNVGGGSLTGLALTPGTPDNGYGHQFSGVSFALNSEFTLGAILSYDPSFVNAVSQLIGGAPSPGFGLPSLPAFARRSAQTIPGVANVWELVGSYDAGELDLGFGFMYGSSNNESKTSAPGASIESEASARMFGFRGGLLYDLGSGSSLGFSAALRLDKATDDSSATGSERGKYSASGTEIQVSGRAKLKVSNKFSFVPYATFATLSAEPKEDAAPAAVAGTPNLTEKVTATAFGVGVGGEYRTSSFYLAGGLSFQTAKAKIEITPPGGTTGTGELTYTALPVVNLGGEWWFTDWLAGRAGYYRALASIKGKTEGGGSSSETTFGFPHSFLMLGALTPANYDGLVTLGLGMRFGGFGLDATVSEEALRRGFGLIGAQDNINTFGYVTINYNFE